MVIENDCVVIYRYSYFNKSIGRRVYAHEFGLKAFKFLIPIDKFKA